MTCVPCARTNAKILVCATPKLQDTARNVVAMNPDRLEYFHIDMTHFSSNVPSTKLDVPTLKGRDVVLIADIRFDYFLQYLALQNEIPRYGARTFHVFCTSFLCATMERVHDGELGSARTFCRALSMAPSAVNGPTQFLLFDPHAPASRFFFNDSVGVEFITAVPLLKEYLKAKFGDKKPVVAWPDEGAFKRFKDLLPESVADRVIFSKQRKGDDRVLTCNEGSDHVKDGRPIVLVDDICNSGNTLLEATNNLVALGAKEVSCFCVHAVFPEESWKKFLPEARKAAGQAVVSEFVCTNTFPSTTDVLKEQGGGFFKVLDIAPIVYAGLGW